MSHHPPSESPLGLAGDAPETDSLPLECQEDHAHEGRNFLWLTLHQVLIRIGWVFKTESIVMPYFLDLVGGGPVLRGWLMVLNRFGFSVPPVLYARSLKLMPQKRWSIAATTLGMAAPFGLLAWVWWSGVWRSGEGAATWMPYLFLLAYAVFFTMTGMNQLAMHSIQGKLIREDRRGRLFAAVMIVGSPIALYAAWRLMPGWLALPDGGFALLFGATALLFALASVAMLGVKESDDDFSEPPAPAHERLLESWRIATGPGPCRGVALVAMLYSTNFMLFPHYQALAREGAGEAFDVRSLMVWTLAQHTAVTLLTLIAGPMADRFGNRLAVIFGVFGSTLGPTMAISLALASTAVMNQWFWLVFLPLGFTPVTIKMIMNYTLELVPREEHPRTVAAVGVCLAAPVIVGSPLLGLLVGMLGSVPMFCLGLAVMLTAGAMAVRLSEPRHDRSDVTLTSGL